MTATITKKQDVIKIQDFDKQSLLDILSLATELKQNPPTDLLKGKILASCFYEPSTRTRLSFESAMYRLGGSVIGFADSNNTSTQKGESLGDTIRMIEHYADILVLRHPCEGSAQYAAEVSSIPVINAGDGSHQHPTQTLLDLLSIQESQGTLENLHIAFAGDLKYGRTTHSLIQALLHFKPRLYMITPPSLELPKEICDLLRSHSIKYSYHRSMQEILHKTDILYMTRLQKERFTNPIERTSFTYQLKATDLVKAKNNLQILHPLPRTNEIAQDVDKTPHAGYFTQAENGLYTRQALLIKLLGASI